MGLQPTEGLRRLLAGGLCLALAGSADAQAAQTNQAVAADAEAIAERAVEEELQKIRPGFRLPMVDDEQTLKQVALFNAYLDERDWSQAFRLLTDLSHERMDAMVPVGDDGLHLALRALIQRRLLAMPADGRRAFQLYFDGQANEQLAAVRNHPRPGSDEQLALAQRLVDRMLASSVGGEAADLLGDFYFERGNFARAGRNWTLALVHGSATGRDALRLQVKQAWAAARGGERDEARRLYEQLSARYGEAVLTIGGNEVDAIAMIGQALDLGGSGRADEIPQAPRPALSMPRPGARPAWNTKFLSEKNVSLTKKPRQDRYYYYGRVPNPLMRHVPPVVADDKGVYFHWLGVVFALDRETGKILWQDGSVGETAGTVPLRQHTGASDPRSYQVALAGESLLVINTSPDDERYNRFALRAYDKASGATLWASTRREDWRLHIGDKAHDASVLGQVLVTDTAGYAVVHPRSMTDCFLRRFDPATGRVEWTMPLGMADALVFDDESKRMPQPLLLAGKGLVYVLTNNGALVAVDTAAGQIDWGLTMGVPFGAGAGASNPWNGWNSPLHTKLDKMANPNGSGSVLLHDGVLYAKQHYGTTLFSIDPQTGRLHWSRDGLDRDARLVGINARRFFLASNKIRGYELDGDRDLVWNNTNNTYKHDQAGALLMGEHILMLGKDELRLARIDNGDFEKNPVFEDEDYLGRSGGRLYRWDNLLVCINRTQITAYRLEPDNDNQP